MLAYSGILAIEKLNGQTYVSCGIREESGTVHSKRYSTVAVSRKVWLLIRRQLEKGVDRIDTGLTAEAIFDLPFSLQTGGSIPNPLPWPISLISASGDVCIGCMTIPFSESMKVAQQLHFKMDTDA